MYQPLSFLSMVLENSNFFVVVMMMLMTMRTIGKVPMKVIPVVVVVMRSESNIIWSHTDFWK